MQAYMVLVHQGMLTIVELTRRFDLTLTSTSRVIVRARTVPTDFDVVHFVAAIFNASLGSHVCLSVFDRLNRAIKMQHSKAKSSRMV